MARRGTNRTSNSKPGARKKPKLATSERSSNVYKWILGFLVVAILTVLAPEHGVFQPIGLPREGGVSQSDVIAPFSFFVAKDQTVLEEERRKAASQVVPLFDYNSSISETQSERVSRFFEELKTARQPGGSAAKLSGIIGEQQLSEETRQLLLDARKAPQVEAEVKSLVANLLRVGVLSQDIPNLDSPNPSIKLRRGDVEQDRKLDDLLTVAMAKETLLKEARARFKGDDAAIKATYELGLLFLAPNVRYNQFEMDRRRLEAMESVPTTKGMVLKGEKIVGSHERITAEGLEKLKSLAIAKQERDRLGRSTSLIYPLLGRLLFNIFVVGLLAGYLILYRKGIFLDNRWLLLLALIVVGQMIIVYLVRTLAGASEFLVPISIAAMLTTILFDAQMGGMMALSVALLYGNVEGFDMATTLMALMVGLAAAYSVTRVRHRRQFYRPMVFISLAYLVSISLMGMMRLTPAGALFKDVSLGMLNGVGTPIVTSGFLFIFEGLFHVTTDITLLELSDSNRPLLRELALRAPGTYHHSINVGYLAEAAAEAIVAHSLLARVASYYHDIGKLEKPEYFVENLSHGSKNPHDKLAPSMSSLILVAHLKDGVELAREARLPRVIIHIIRQHHGTSLMSFFYYKALDQGAGKEVEGAYRYPGPKPETKEAAIVMLADAVEAASRTLEEATPSRLRGMIRKIIQDKFTAGELDDCELTLKDLHKIEESFFHTMSGTYHQRVEYPVAEEEGRKAKSVGRTERIAEMKNDTP